VDLYIHSSIRLHGVMLNLLSTGTTLPFLHILLLSLNLFYKLGGNIPGSLLPSAGPRALRYDI
jgi:hypothetical protein